MSRISADTVYEAAFVPSWEPTGPVGHLEIRRLDDRVAVVRLDVDDPDRAEALLHRAESDLRGPLDTFESTWSVPADLAADTGPDVAAPPPQYAPEVPSTPATPSAAGTGRPAFPSDPGITVFPDSSTVFGHGSAETAALIHPLVTIDPAALSGDTSSADDASPAGETVFAPETWRALAAFGPVHLVNPIVPVDGVLGEGHEPTDDLDPDTRAHTAPNWLLFRADEAGRYRFLGDPEVLTADPSHVERANAEFAGSSARYRRLHTLTFGDHDDPTRVRDGWGTDLPAVDRLGGGPGWGNWTAFGPPAALRLDEPGGGPGDDPDAGPTLRLADGRAFHFVAATAGYPWRHEGPDAILLFVEPESRTVALTFDWG
ncbi:hypothetical protein [Brevibacterium litoralis]|uniref:hypothetical protein n=1 Tax=Brevibacterium litoralis TaxID=3138935 RepID=UPI0032EF69EE